MDTFEIKDEDIDVEDIMRQIRENIKKQKGVGSNNESIINKPLGTKDEELSLQNNLNYINSNWDVQAEYKIRSHRRYLGSILVWVRQLIHGEVQRYVDPTIGRQNEFNNRVTHILNSYRKVFDTLAAVKNIFETSASMNKDIENKAWLANMLDVRVKKGIESLPFKENDDIMNYFVFEEKFRGSIEDIKKRQSIFLEYFKSCQNVLDIGCGRGELLSLLKDNGIGAKGIDMNEDMVLYCQKLGLDVQKAEAVSYLQSSDDKSLDGVFSGQVVEHLKPLELINLVKLSYDKMKYGTYFIAETINPLCLSVFAKSFYMDMTHVKPVHPVTIKFLMESAGFRDVEFKFFSPHNDEAKLDKIEISNELDEKSRMQLELMNKNIDKLNELLYGYQDYAVIGKK
jgi:O-antigen chain-terminating methyltransferase